MTYQDDQVLRHTHFFQKSPELGRDIPGPATFLYSEDFPKGNYVHNKKVRIFASLPKIWSSKQALTAQYGTWSFKISPKNFLKLNLQENNTQKVFLKDKNPSITVTNMYYMLVFQYISIIHDLKQTCKELGALIVSNGFQKHGFYKNTL